MSLSNLAAKEASKKLASNNNLRNLLASNLPSHLKHKILAVSTKANIARQVAQIAKVKARINQNMHNTEQARNRYNKANSVYGVALTRGTITPQIRREYINAGRQYAKLLPKYEGRSLSIHLDQIESGVNKRTNMYSTPSVYYFQHRAYKGNQARLNSINRSHQRLLNSLSASTARAPNKYPRLARLRRFLTRRKN